MTDSPPERLGSYRIERLLGVGGMGKVYLGRPDLGPPRAVKVLHHGGAIDALRREASNLTRLRHPRLVELVFADLTHEPPFLVMELMEGGSLRDRLPVTSEQEARSICEDVLEGLGYAHDQGAAHLDLKPENILFDDRGNAKISDFGLAIFPAGEDVAVSLASLGDGTSGGTLAYMAPEQRDGQRGDRRADIYSFGLILSEVFSGKRPQAGETLHELLGRRPPDWANNLFARSYCRYERRFGSATEALAALRPKSVARPPQARTVARESGRGAAHNGHFICLACNRRLPETEATHERHVCSTCLGKVPQGHFFCLHCKRHCDARDRPPGSDLCVKCKSVTGAGDASLLSFVALCAVVYAAFMLMIAALGKR